MGKGLYFVYGVLCAGAGSEGDGRGGTMNRCRSGSSTFNGIRRRWMLVSAGTLWF